MTRPRQPLARIACVMLEPVDRRLGGRQDLDVEALEQRARTELRTLQALADAVEVSVRGARAQMHTQAEHVVKDVVEPER